MTPPRVPLSLAALVLAAACGANGDDASDTRDRASSREPDATTTTTDPQADDETAVRAARSAANEARWQATAQPANPALPALTETMTGAVLDRAVSDAHENQRTDTHHVRGSAARLDVRTVAFDGTDAAYLDTCEVVDVTVYSARTGLVLDFRSGTATLHRTEEMRRDGGVWRLAVSSYNTRAEGINGCAHDAPPPTGAAEMSDDDQAAVIAARERAETAWLDALHDPARPAPADLYTAELLRQFTPDSGVPDWVHALLSRDCIPIWNPQTGRATSARACVDRAWQGAAGEALILRGDGIAFAPHSTSTVTVQSVTWPRTPAPTVAYLRTCRTYNLTRNDGAPLATPIATVHATEAMHYEAGAWKLAARWNHTPDVNAPPCLSPVPTLARAGGPGLQPWQP